MIRCIIVDDEFPARECLHNYLRDYCHDVEVVAQADSVKAAVEAILRYKPDLVFLDVEMPNGSGFDVLRQLNTIDFSVVFVTAFEEYAVTAFRFSATDYLLKPVNITELTEAVGKVRSEMSKKADTTNVEALLKLMDNDSAEWNVIIIPNSEGFNVLEIHDIISCEADGYCTIFHLRGNRKIVSSRNLKNYDELLTGHGFLRVHNSFVINLRYVREYSSEGVITLSDNQCAPLGNTYKKRFLEYFERHR